VFLTENMRAKRDPEFIQLLSDLRWGRLTDTQLAALNTRVLGHVPVHLTSDKAFYRPIVVSTNELRCAINRNMMFEAAQRLNLPIYECLAVPSERSKPVLERIVNLNDDQTQRIPTKLAFYIGMPVMLTRKHPQLLEANVVANGVLGTIVGFAPPPDTLMFRTAKVLGVTIKTLQQQPKLLLIKIAGSSKTMVNGFPPGVIGLPPLRTHIKLPKIPNLNQATLTLQQFATVPAFSCTTEKLQGQTCHDGIVVTRLERQKGVPPQTLYVALSRSLSLDGITLIEPITRAYLAKFKPNQATVDEMKRLIDLVKLPPYISITQRVAFEGWKLKQAA
jgi:hypothetical protein